VGNFGGHAQLIEDLDARRLDGVLLLAPQHDQDEAGLLRKYGVPFVALGGGPRDWLVTFDWDQFLRAAARELARAGSRRIGLIGPLTHAAPLAQGLREAGAGEPVIADWSYETWASIIPGAGSRENCARRVTEQMIAAAATAPLPDTLVSLEDTATRGALIALMDAGIKPGRDIRVITAANKGSPVLDAWADDLVQFAFDPAEIMQAALGMLETVMNGGKPTVNPMLIAPHVARASSP
jgi:DNA-binding LacI/PurR family transcriptional regulator